MSSRTESTAAPPPPAPRSRRRYGLTGWVLLPLLAIAGAQIFGFMVSAPDRDMGHLQKIMYVHVPAAWMAFIAFFVVFGMSLAYLWRGNPRRDLLAASAAEAGAVMTALTLALGSIWGRPTWGVWWTWDPRLTSTAVLLVVFVSYLALRSFIDDFDRRARWSAAVGILGFLNVPVVYLSVRWWRSIHQVQSTPSTVDPTYAWGLRLNAIAFLIALVYLIRQRYRAALLEHEADRIIEERALGAPGGSHAG